METPQRALPNQIEVTEEVAIATQEYQKVIEINSHNMEETQKIEQIKEVGWKTKVHHGIRPPLNRSAAEDTPIFLLILRIRRLKTDTHLPIADKCINIVIYNVVLKQSRYIL